MPFISNTDKERQEMLAKIGVTKFEDLLTSIPEHLRLREPLHLEKPMSELEITRRMQLLASENLAACCTNSFLGGGIYSHFIPAAVDHIVIRPEFLTAYTPYQAEVSQGTLQYIYEYQTLICELTGMEISNAGMYDGATAAAEAVLMAVRESRRNKALLPATLHPSYRQVIRTYTEGVGIELVDVPMKDGITDVDALKGLIDDNTACVLVQTPNFFGNIEPVFDIEPLVHAKPKTLFVAAVDPISLGVMNAPAEYKADVVIGDGQALGNRPSFGGPQFGFFATRMALNRQMPGRIVGETVDADGRRAYSLTLQAREQHIRRAKATSNICSNQSLCCLAAAVYLCMMGREGLIEVAKQSLTKAHYLAGRISEIKGFSMAFNQPFFKEFAVKTPVPAGQIYQYCADRGVLAGIDLKPWGRPDTLLIAVTETRTREQLDAFVRLLQEVNNG